LDGEGEHGAFVDRADRGREPRQVAVQFGHEVGHVGEQGVLVLQERLRRGVGGPHDLAERQVELRGAAGHVVEDGVQAGQPAVDLVAVGFPGGGVQRAQVLEDVGEDEAGEVRVPDAGAQHVLDGGVGAVAELAELVDRLAVPVPGQAAGPGGVLQPVQDRVVRQGVEAAAQRGEVVEPGHVRVDQR
jgi:hypothetical protein